MDYLDRSGRSFKENPLILSKLSAWKIGSALTLWWAPSPKSSPQNAHSIEISDF
jgi:hypothetical protein